MNALIIDHITEKAIPNTPKPAVSTVGSDIKDSGEIAAPPKNIIPIPITNTPIKTKAIIASNISKASTCHALASVNSQDLSKEMKVLFFSTSLTGNACEYLKVL